MKVINLYVSVMSQIPDTFSLCFYLSDALQKN